MALAINPETEYGKELAKHNKPWSFVAFPMMLYMAHDFHGVPSAGEPSDEQFTKRCQLTVNSEAELRKALDKGWRKTQVEALARHGSKQRDKSDVAAARNYEDRNMSPKAKAEAKKVEDDTDEHVPEIPEKPRARKGRTVRKTAA